MSRTTLDELHALVTDRVVGGVARTHVVDGESARALYRGRDEAGHEAADVDHVLGGLRQRVDLQPDVEFLTSHEASDLPSGAWLPARGVG